MAKDKAKSPSKDASPAKTAEAPTATADAPKTEAADSSGPAETASPKKSSGGGRPISHFSSVSTDEYRSGWEDIFGSAKKAAPAKRKKPKLPTSLAIDFDDLDASAREALDAAARKLAKNKRLKFDDLLENGQVEWRISCEISDE